MINYEDMWKDLRLGLLQIKSATASTAIDAVTSSEKVGYENMMLGIDMCIEHMNKVERKHRK